VRIVETTATVCLSTSRGPAHPVDHASRSACAGWDALQGTRSACSPRAQAAEGLRTRCTLVVQ
jgi:hypothetical protein